MAFDKSMLPDPVAYFENQGHTIFGRGGKRFRTDCTIHGGTSPNLSVLRESGAFFCFACGAKGGDILAYEMQATGSDFVTAAKALNAWVDDGKPRPEYKPTALSPRNALLVLATESNLIAIAGHNVANGVELTQVDLARIRMSASRIDQIQRDFS